MSWTPTTQKNLGSIRRGVFGGEQSIIPSKVYTKVKLVSNHTNTNNIPYGVNQRDVDRSHWTYTLCTIVTLLQGSLG